jgi:acetyl esterase/lipase
MSSVIHKIKDAVSGETGTAHHADSDMQAVLNELAALNGKPIETLDAAAARAQPTPADAVRALLRRKRKNSSPGALVTEVTSMDRQIDGATGPLEVRVYTPSGVGPFPVVVYFHGGGWVIADRVVYDGGARGLSKFAQAIVVSIDYRRSPEAKFPAAWDDAFAAYQWVAANAADINGVGTQLALAGESAGGNLAIATAIAARDRGATRPLAVLAVYPVGQTGDMQTPSYVDSADAKPLNKAMMGWFVDKLVASPADTSDPRLDLVHANLADLPPVTIINAEMDPLRSDGEMLEAALRGAGVEVTRKVYDGVTHEFFGMAAVVKKAKEAQAFAGKQLKRYLNP